jgi:predicted enzyme related to lactoylglutathione lyase
VIIETRKEVPMSVQFFSISLDCEDAGKLAGFWSEVLDRPVDPGPTDEFAAIGLAGSAGTGPVWMFHKVPEPKTAKNRAHIDFVSPELDKEVKRVVALGAVHIRDVEEGGYRWATLADPQGNEFDVVAVPST